MKVKINSNFYIIIYFILMILMNQSIGLSYINVISFLFLFISLKNINVSKCLATKIYCMYVSYAMTVSYTHLDVYKRQIYIFSLKLILKTHLLLECLQL